MVATRENSFTPDQDCIEGRELDLTTPRGIMEAVITVFIYRESLISWIVPSDKEQESLWDRQQKEAERALLKRFGEFSERPQILERAALRYGHEAAILYWDQAEKKSFHEKGIEVSPAFSVVANWRRSAHRGALEYLNEIDGRRP